MMVFQFLLQMKCRLPNSTVRLQQSGKLNSYEQVFRPNIVVKGAEAFEEDE